MSVFECFFGAPLLMDVDVILFFRLKLVEKGLPNSEEDQIKSQDSLKRSVEMDSRPSMPQENLKRSVELDASIIIPQFNKKLKTEDIIEPDVKQVDRHIC